MSNKKDKLPPVICQKLWDIRKAKGWSAQMVADKTGYSLQSVQRYEKIKSPPFDYVYLVVKAAQVRPEFLFDETDTQIFTSEEIKDLRSIVNQLLNEVEQIKAQVKPPS